MKIVILFNNCKNETKLPMLAYAILRANGKLTIVDCIYYSELNSFKRDTMTLMDFEVYNLKKFFSIYNQE